MEQKNYGRNYNVKKKQYAGEYGFIEKNSMKQNKKARSDTGAEERRWTSLGRQYNSLCRWTNTFPIIGKFRNKCYIKTTILQMSDIQDKQECWNQSNKTTGGHGSKKM